MTATYWVDLFKLPLFKNFDTHVGFWVDLAYQKSSFSSLISVRGCLRMVLFAESPASIYQFNQWLR